MRKSTRRRPSKRRSRQPKRFAPRRLLRYVEQLEDRRVLDANPLAMFEGTIEPADSVDVIELSLVGGDSSNVIALRVAPTSGNLDPAELLVQRPSGSTVTPLVSLADVGTTRDSFMVINVPSGSFDVTVGSEGGTGDFRLSAYLLGDLDDGIVSQHEVVTADAAERQGTTIGNHVTQLFYRQFGVNLGVDQYDEAFDADMNGVIDSFDTRWIDRNVGAPRVTAELIGETDLPVITVMLDNDTGIESLPDTLEDGITRDTEGAIITGTVDDASQILSFMASINSTDPADFVDVTDSLEDNPNVTPPNNGTASIFSFDLQDLADIFDGEEVANQGSLTLRLVATDSLGNEISFSEAIGIDFEIDTLAPLAPDVALDPQSDSNLINDSITNVNAPNFLVNAENGALVELFSSLVDGGATPIGSGVVGSSEISITSQPLQDGTHTITGRVTDLAGNVGVSSSGLQVTIDTQIAEVSLTMVEDFGVEFPDVPGDGQSPVQIVDLTGTTEAGATVQLFVDDSSAAIASTVATGGVFTFMDIDLGVYGERDYRAEAMDNAGNTVSVTETFARNQLPALVDESTTVSVTEDEDAASVEIDLTTIFEDADIINGDLLNFFVTSNNSSLVTTSLVDNGSNGFEFDTLVVSFVPDANGSTTIDLETVDRLGLSVMTTIDVTVNPVNDPPSFDLPATFTSIEDEGVNEPAFATNISPGAANETGQTPIFNVTTDNDDLFAVMPQIDANGNLTYTPADDAFGAATVTVTLMDDGGGDDTSAPKMFDLTILSSNDAPTFALAGDVTVDEDSDAQTVENFATDLSTGPGNESDQNLVAFVLDVATEDDDKFEVMPAINVLTGELTYQLAANAIGTVTVSVQLVDDGGTANGGQDVSDARTFDIVITDLPDPPTAFDDELDVLVNQEFTDLDVLENDTIDPDINETLTIKSVTQPTGGLGTVEIIDGGSLVRFTPDASATVGQTDTFTYTIVDDDNLTSTATATVTFVENSVVAVDDEIPIDEGEIAAGLDVLKNDFDPQGDTFTIVGISDGDQGGAFSIEPDGLSVRYTPVADFSGTEIFTYTIRDDQIPFAEATATVTITVAPLNDPPEFTLPTDPDQEVLEGTGLHTISGFATNISKGGTVPSSEADQTLTFILTTNNDGLFGDLPAIDPDTGDLTFSLANDDIVSSATVTVTLMDDGGTDKGGEDTSASQTFEINVIGINDAPSFTIGGDQSASDAGGEKTFTGFATNISRGGGSDENSQTLIFELSTNNDSLFSVLPTINPATGDLTFTPEVNASGMAEVTVTLMDNGGTANGGVDTSAPQMFNITISNDNIAPVVANPLADLVRNDADSPSPEQFDLSNVFNDPDGDNLSFVATSSNEELVTVQIVGGDQLQLTYLPYAANQDRTPSVITVTATDDGSGMLSQDDVFTVTVTPEITVDVQLVALSEATPLDGDGGLSRTTLPESITQVPVGETYVVEVWIKDLLTDSLIAGVASQGLVGGTFDVNFDNTLGEATALTSANHAGAFNDLEFGEVNNAEGLVEGFGGGAVNQAGLAVEPNYSRLGFVEFIATEAGPQMLSLDLDSSDRTTNPTDNPARTSIDNNVPTPANGSIDISQINLGTINLEHIATMEFTIDSSQSELTLSGTLAGETLTPQQVGVSNTPEASGTLTVAVTDDLANPTMLRILDSQMSWDPTGDWSPDGTGTAGTAPAIVGFENPQFMALGSPVALLLAMRNLSASILMDEFVALNGAGEFPASDWQGFVDSADIHGFVNTSPASQQLTNVEVVDNGAAAASLTQAGNVYTLTLPMNHTLTATAFFGFQLDLNITGQIVATFTDSGGAAAAASSGPPSEEEQILAAFDAALSTWDD